MGTNYYLHRKDETCPNCGHTDKPKHIGKSSGGWCFALHVYPSEGILTLKDWQKIYKKRDALIYDEYGTKISKKEMDLIITDRAWNRDMKFPYECKAFGIYYASIEDYYRQHNADKGPNNLLRHKVDGRFCIGQGDGTWDLCVGDFS